MYNNYVNLVGNFSAGDNIKVDLKESKVYLNNVLDMSIWGLDSKAHKICRGYNRYTISNATLKVKYNKQYL